MSYLFLLVGVALALVVVWRGYSSATVSDDLSTLSKGQLKQTIAFARLVVKNDPDEGKRAEAAATIERLQDELDRRAAG